MPTYQDKTKKKQAKRTRMNKDEEYGALPVDWDSDDILGGWLHNEPLIDVFEPAPSQPFADVNVTASLNSNESARFFGQPTNGSPLLCADSVANALVAGSSFTTPWTNGSSEDNTMEMNHDSKRSPLKRLLVDTQHDDCVTNDHDAAPTVMPWEPDTSKAVCFGWIKHNPTKFWRGIVKKFSDDHNNYQGWTDEICEKVKTLLAQKGITRFMVCQRNGNKIFNGEAICGRWIPASDKETLEKTRQRFLDDRKKHASASKCGKKMIFAREKSRSSNSSPETSESFCQAPQSSPSTNSSMFAFQPNFVVGATPQFFPSVPDCVATGQVSPSVPDLTFESCQNRNEQEPQQESGPLLREFECKYVNVTTNVPVSERQQRCTITDKDVCFGWKNHPGTVRWREVVQEFSTNMQEYPQWNDDIVILVKEKLDREGIVIFLVFLDDNFEPSLTIDDGMWYRAFPNEILEKTKEQFLRHRQQLQANVKPGGDTSPKRPPANGGPGGNSSWEDSSNNRDDSASPHNQHRMSGGQSKRSSSSTFSSLPDSGYRCTMASSVIQHTDQPWPTTYKQNTTRPDRDDKDLNDSSLSDLELVCQTSSSPQTYDFLSFEPTTPVQPHRWPASGYCVVSPNAKHNIEELASHLPQSLAEHVDFPIKLPEFEKQTRCAIMPNDVCFEWSSHPGTMRWRKVVQSFSTNTEDYPEWDDEIADLIKVQLDDEDILFLSPNNTPGGTGHLAAPKEILNRTKQQFYQDRQQLGLEPSGKEHCLGRGSFSFRGSSAESFSWDDCSGQLESSSPDQQHVIGQTNPALSNRFLSSSSSIEGRKRCQSWPTGKQGARRPDDEQGSSNVSSSNMERLFRTDARQQNNDVRETRIDTADRAQNQPPNGQDGTVDFPCSDAQKQRGSSIQQLSNERTNKTSSTPYTITHRDVCFEWSNHPGTVMWREVVRRFSTNTQDYPEWNDKIVDLINEKLEKEDIKFLERGVTIDHDTGHRVSPIKIFNNTKEQFLRDRQQPGHELAVDTRGLNEVEPRRSTNRSCSCKNPAPNQHSIGGQSNISAPDVYTPLTDPPNESLVITNADHVSLLTKVLAQMNIETGHQIAEMVQVEATGADASPPLVPTAMLHQAIEALPVQAELVSDHEQRIETQLLRLLGGSPTPTLLPIAAVHDISTDTSCLEEALIDSNQVTSLDDEVVNDYNNSNGWAVLHWAKTAAAWLFRDQTDTCTRVLNRDTPLHLACKIGDEITVAKLVTQRRADPNAQNNIGWTPLHEASFHGHESVASMILLHRANPNAPNNVGDTPLHKASFNGHDRLVALLIQYEADPNVKNKSEETPLQIACTCGHVAIVALLLQHQANPNTANKSGRTPLHVVSLRGDATIVDLLLQHEANSNTRDKLGETPLHKASSCGHKDVAKLLLQHRADPTAKNRFGATPYELANQRGYEDVAAMLLQ